jgi:hypothetical protein
VAIDGVAIDSVPVFAALVKGTFIGFSDKLD